MFAVEMKLRLLLIVCCSVMSVALQAQVQAPPAKHITYIPFTMLTGGVIILHATIDSLPDTLNFVLDSGSGGISLDSATCNDLGIPKQMSKMMIKGIAGVRPVEFAYNHTLNLHGISVEDLDFHINDYDILTSVYGMKIDGIIGYSFLHRYLVVINYEKSRIEILTKGEYKYPRGGHVLHPRFTTLPMQTITMRDERKVSTTLFFDTGAGLCFLLSENFVNDSAFFKDNKKMYPTLAQGLGGKADMNITTVKEVRIGPYRFRNVPTYIFNDPYNATSYPQVSGLIGNDIMRRFTVILNYGKQEIYIKPNTFFRDSFDYSYTGVGIYLVEGEVMVLDIMKGSPGDKAGLEIGDVIVAVNKDFSNNIQSYKTALQSPRTTQNLLVRREKIGLMTILLKVDTIF